MTRKLVRFEAHPLKYEVYVREDVDDCPEDYTHKVLECRTLAEAAEVMLSLEDYHCDDYSKMHFVAEIKTGRDVTDIVEKMISEAGKQRRIIEDYAG